MSKKKVQERRIFDMVYATQHFDDVVDSESPDFLVRLPGHDEYFGVEVAEFFHSETNARIERITEYVGELLAGSDFRHKQDRQTLDVVQFDILTQDKQIKAKGVKGIMQKVATPRECACKVAELVQHKSQRFRDATNTLTHLNLIVLDKTRLLTLAPVEEFYRLYFVPELRAALCDSPFREVFFVTNLDRQLGFVPLNMLHLLSEVYSFNAVFVGYELPDALPAATDELELFASYFKTLVTADVLVRRDHEGTEVIYGDTGILVTADRSVHVRMYSDHPLPTDCQPATAELASLLGEAFRDEMLALREAKTFVTRLWFPVEKKDVV